MLKGTGKDSVIILDSQTLKEMGTYPTVNVAAEELKLNASSIRFGIFSRYPIYNCYWVYSKDYPTWKPAMRFHRKTKVRNTSDELEKLRTHTAM